MTFRAPRCPGCDEPPMMAMDGGRQAFCGNDARQVLTWDMHDDPAQFKGESRAHRPARLEGRVSERGDMCRQIAADLAEDTRRWDGQPLTGQNVATTFGELAACVAVLARLVAAMDEERT